MRIAVSRINSTFNRMHVFFSRDDGTTLSGLLPPTSNLSGQLMDHGSSRTLFFTGTGSACTLSSLILTAQATYRPCVLLVHVRPQRHICCFPVRDTGFVVSPSLVLYLISSGSAQDHLRHTLGDISPVSLAIQHLNHDQMVLHLFPSISDTIGY